MLAFVPQIICQELNAPVQLVRRAVPEQGPLEPKRRQPLPRPRAGTAGRLVVPRDRALHALLPRRIPRCVGRLVAVFTMTSLPQPQSEVVLSADVSQATVDQLFKSEASQLRRYFRRKTGDYDRAADLVQDAFVKMAEAPVANIHNPAAYLQRIARNLIADWFRNRRGHLFSEHIPLEECDASVSAPQEDLYLFERAVSGMSQKTRDVFLLKRVEGLTYEQIARRLGISPKTVEYHMGQALAHIKWFLEGQ